MTGFTRAGLILALLAAALALLLSGYFLGFFEHSAPTAANPPDLSKHPIYRDYQFSHQDNVIDLGIQPLWLPGVISEVMRRDTILRSALAEHGLEIRFHAFLKGADVNFYLAQGDLEGGIGGDMPTLTGCAKSELSVVSLIDQSFTSIVAPQKMMVPELKGKRIGYGFGSNAHYRLMETLADEGLDPGEVQLISMDVIEMAAALQQGNIDAFAAWEPTPTIALSKYPGLVTISRGLTTGYLYFSRPFAGRERAAVKDIVASQLRAMDWIRKSTDNLLRASEWTLAAGQALGGADAFISAELFSAAVNDGLLGISSLAQLPEKDLVVNGTLFREFHFLQKIGKISQASKWADVASCFDQTLVPEIISQAKQFQLQLNNLVEDVPGPG